MKIEMVGERRNVLSNYVDGRLASAGGGATVAAQVRSDQAEVNGESALRREKAPMRHQSVKQEKRPALAFLFESDACAVPGREMPQA
jgi:hypothetical protein